MKTDSSSTLGVSVLIIFEIAIIIWLLFAFGNSLYNDYRGRKYFDQEFHEIASLRQEKNYREMQFRMISTEQYKDKWAKENQKKKNPGENVIKLPTDTVDPFEKQFEGLSEKEIQIEKFKTHTPQQQWWEYFFSDELHGDY